VPIQLVLEGGAAEGYIIANQSVQPREILVTGDQQALDGLSSINTNAVKLDNVTQDTELAVTLNLPEGVHLVNSNEQVKAALDIQKIITSDVEINTIGYRNLDPRFAFGKELSGTITVTVRGPEDLVNNAAQNIELYVDLRNAKEGEDSYEILWDTASKLEILEVSPQRISVDIVKRE
jgi:YbbR domain-containing protein